MTTPPWRTGKPAESLSSADLDGMLLAFDGDGPMTLSVQGSDREHLPCFSTVEGLREIMGSSCRVKQIDDGAEFLSSVPLEMEVILDPQRTAAGTVRYTLLQTRGQLS